MSDSKRSEILAYVRNNPALSSKEIHEGLSSQIGYATVKRILTSLISDRMIITEGIGRGTRYRTGPAYELFYPTDLNEYFSKEIDERKINEGFNLSLITEVFNQLELFSEEEFQSLSALQNIYKGKKSRLSESAYKKELERLAIDFTWKSSQIEGNTYSLLETERLLKEKETAKGKARDEAVMLLNHKEAIDFIINDPSTLFPLNRSTIEKIHTLLMSGLGIELAVRTHGVGITGTNYKPPEYEQQIIKALVAMCTLVNDRDSVFEKALLLLVLISYIQPFVDGNKRTARIVSNAALIHQGYCPVSFRTVDALEYKKAMLLFYEQNNITPFKKIFMDQFEFAVNAYF